MRSGRISLLVDSPLRDMLVAVRGVPAEVRSRIQQHTQAEALPIWSDELRGRGATRLQQRALVDSARVGVTARNVMLRSGSVGRLSSGTPVGLVSQAAEWGANENKQIQQRSRAGNVYTRRLGNAFGAPARRGNVVRPAARDSIPRFGALWFAICVRTVLDALETGAN